MGTYGRNYEKLKAETNRGWNTWNTMSMLSYVHLPHGFAINLCLKDFSSDKVLREFSICESTGEGALLRPEPRTYNGSYIEINVSYRSTEINIRSTVIGDDQIIVVSPVHQGLCTPALIVEACLLWGREGAVSKENGALYGRFEDREFIVYSSGKRCVLPYTHSLSPSVAVPLDRAVVVSTVPISLEEAERFLGDAKTEMQKHDATFGTHREAVEAMRTCLAWNTVYDPENDTLCTPVSRAWNMGWGGYVLFGWDTFFGVLMLSVENVRLAQLNALAILKHAAPEGFIPNFCSANHARSLDRSQPPVGAHACLETYYRSPERWFLEAVYPGLLRWNEWYFEHRGTPDGNMCWGSNPAIREYDKWLETFDVHTTFGGSYESGMDRSPMYEGVPFDEDANRMRLADVGLMGMYVLDCRSLEEIARILGREGDIPKLHERCKKVESAILRMWSPKKKIFCNMRTDTSEFSDRISPTSFYAFLADGVTDEQKCDMILTWFRSADKFGGEVIMPAISRDDPAYVKQQMEKFSGRVWPPVNYLVYVAMRHIKLDEECEELARKSETLFLHEWRMHRHVHENYDANSGLGDELNGSDRFYHWGALLGYIALDWEKKNATM
jgi:hypothetical protein